MTSAIWAADLLGEGYEQHTMELGTDPDGQGDVAAVLVRRKPRAEEQVRGVVPFLLALLLLLVFLLLLVISTSVISSSSSASLTLSFFFLLTQAE